MKLELEWKSWNYIDKGEDTEFVGRFAAAAYWDELSLVNSPYIYLFVAYRWVLMDSDIGLKSCTSVLVRDSSPHVKQTLAVSPNKEIFKAPGMS